MKKLFKDWTKFEIGLLLTSIIVVLGSGIFAKSNLLVIMSSIAGVSCALTQAKGKVISQFIGLIVVVLYSMVSFQNRYYGEVLIYVFLMFPLFVGGIISWIKNVNKENDTVNKNDLKPKEWIVLAIISVVMFVVLYYLLKYFNTDQLLVSTLSMLTVLFATYLVARRSKYGFLFYMANDIILIILWGLPIIYGNLALIPMVCEPVINLINDTYGWRSWNKREN